MSASRYSYRLSSRYCSHPGAATGCHRLFYSLFYSLVPGQGSRKAPAEGAGVGATSLSTLAISFLPAEAEQEEETVNSIRGKTCAQITTPTTSPATTITTELSTPSIGPRITRSGRRWRLSPCEYVDPFFPHRGGQAKNFLATF